MKKIAILAMAFALALVSCSKSDSNEPETFVCSFDSSYFDALVDNPQYDGPQLYGTGYSWRDAETDICGGLTDSWGDHKFWGGGIAISNYCSTDFAANGTFEQQLTVYNKKAHSGRNFAIVNGYKGAYGDSRGCLTFASAPARVKSLWVCATTYSYFVAKNGSAGVCEPLKDGQQIVITATGYDASDKEISSATFVLYDGTKKAVTEWTKWDLSALGLVKSIRFDMTDGGEEMSHPAYFAIDDITTCNE